MANWCNNELKVIGETGELEKMLTAIRSVSSDGKVCALDFDKIIPYPQRFKDQKGHLPLEEMFSPEGGFMWRLMNWGTKSNAADVSLTRINANAMIIRFETAYAPTLGITATLSELYPDLAFLHIYDEIWSDFAGYAEYCNGDLQGQGKTDFDHVFDALYKIVKEETSALLNKESLHFSNLEFEMKLKVIKRACQTDAESCGGSYSLPIVL